MNLTQRAVDADRHVIEPVEIWKQYLEPEYRVGAPYLELRVAPESVSQRLERLGPDGLLPPMPTLMLDGEPVWHRLSERALLVIAASTYEQAHQLRAGAVPQGQLATMDRAGIDRAFLYPTAALYLLRIDAMEPARAAAFSRAYNSWLRDFCLAEPKRLKGVGALSLHDPEQLVPELERVASFGFRAVVLSPTPVRGRLLSDPAYEPFWSACERLSIGVALHEVTHARLPTTGADRFHTRFALHACSHPMEQMMGFLALVEGGVLERHPKLRVALLEAGCGWVPYWLWRMDQLCYRHMYREIAQTIRRRPSEYFRRQCFVSVEPDEPNLSEVVQSIGPDNLLFGSDFPHTDHDGDVAGMVSGLRARLPEAFVGKILWDNPVRFYGLDD